jgi:hypothetical protein
MTSRQLPREFFAHAQAHQAVLRGAGLGVALLAGGLIHADEVAARVRCGVRSIVGLSRTCDAGNSNGGSAVSIGALRELPAAESGGRGGRAEGAGRDRAPLARAARE